MAIRFLSGQGVTGNITVSGTGSFGGNVTLTGNLDVNLGEVQMTDGYSIQWGGNAILNHSGSATTIGDNTSSSVLTLAGGNAIFAGDLFPASTGASDLGSSAKKFGSLFVNGIAVGVLTPTTIQLNGDFKILDKAQSAYIGFATRNTSGSEVVMDITNAGSATFAGDVSVEDNLYLTDSGVVRGKLILNASDRDNVELRAESLGSTMKFFTCLLYTSPSPRD